MFRTSNNPKEVQFIQKMNNLAGELRKKPTAAEMHLWKYLRKNRLLGYKFRRQFAIDKYIVDFICCEQKLVIEVDGLIHVQQMDYDQCRDEYLRLLGYKTMRFSNEVVLEKTREVLNSISSILRG